MRLQLASGVILNTDNESLVQQYLKYGAVEYKAPAEAIVKEAPKTTRNKSVKYSRRC